MCGIAGYVGQGTQEILEEMCNRIAHRGPDDDGYWIDDGVGLGHRRLSIIDLAGGHQPMTNEERTIWVVFNGEIYNYQELRQDLEQRGHQFSTNSDTEAIVHAYEEFGHECQHRFQGMFAFALWNTQERELFCARDRLGIKPFFWTQVDGQFLFASEIKALLAHPMVKPPINRNAFHEYLSFGFVPGPHTIFEGIQHLPPGSYLVHRNGHTVIREYWRPEATWDGFADFRQAKDQLLATLSESVENRLIADVPIGAYLSGGVDSSLLVSLMTELQTQEVTTLSVGFGEGEYDETPYSTLVSQELGTRHVPLSSDSSNLDILPSVAYLLDQPLNDAATLPTYEMARLTKEHVTVVLTGEGADECFSGYSHMKYLRYLLDPVLGGAVRTGGALLHLAAKAFGRRKRSLELIGDCDSTVDMVNTIFGRFSADEKRQLYGSAMLDDVEDFEVMHSDLLQRKLGDGTPYEQIVRFYLQTLLPDDLLVKTDRMTMAHGIEARVPYLDHRVVNLAFSLPPSHKVRGWTDKFILRQVAKERLPQQVWRRRKQGFGVPLEKWLDVGAAERRREAREKLANEGLIDEETWSAWLEGRHPNYRDNTQSRTLLFFEEWLAAYSDEIQW